MAEASNVSATPAPPAPAAKPLPPKPAAPAKPPAAKGRRSFLFAMFASWFAIGWLSLTAAVIGMVLGTVRFLFPNVLSEPPSKIKVGFPAQYEEGKVVDRFKDQNTWVVRYQGLI